MTKLNFSLRYYWGLILSCTSVLHICIYYAIESVYWGILIRMMLEGQLLYSGLLNFLSVLLYTSCIYVPCLQNLREICVIMDSTLILWFQGQPDQIEWDDTWRLLKPAIQVWLKNQLLAKFWWMGNDCLASATKITWTTSSIGLVRSSVTSGHICPHELIF